MIQKIILGLYSNKQLESMLYDLSCGKIMLVQDRSFPYLSLVDIFKKITVPHVPFNDFTPNPSYDDICKGVSLFRAEGCDVIIAVGGGSTIDVAKCIKLYCKMDLSSSQYYHQEYKDSNVPLIAIPTTAGTGSESTCFAVMYLNGEKQSVYHESIIPEYVILEPSLLKTLPSYQKKCALLDALCQGIESWWSLNSTPESRKYSRKAVSVIIENYRAYIFGNDSIAAEQIMLAANRSGYAINIAQTTAAHAMSYKLTSLHDIPHGHAVAICMPHVWRYMVENLDKCIDPRGKNYVRGIFLQIGRVFGEQTPNKSIEYFDKLMTELQMPSINPIEEKDVQVLSESVNAERLKNNPIPLSNEAIRELYMQIANRKRREV